MRELINQQSNRDPAADEAARRRIEKQKQVDQENQDPEADEEARRRIEEQRRQEEEREKQDSRCD